MVDLGLMDDSLPAGELNESKRKSRIDRLPFVLLSSCSASVLTPPTLAEGEADDDSFFNPREITVDRHVVEGSSLYARYAVFWLTESTCREVKRFHWIFVSAEGTGSSYLFVHCQQARVPSRCELLTREIDERLLLGSSFLYFSFFPLLVVRCALKRPCSTEDENFVEQSRLIFDDINLQVWFDERHLKN